MTNPIDHNKLTADLKAVQADIRLRAFITPGWRPIEADIVARVFNALQAAGDPIVRVFDGEEDSRVRTLDDVNMLVFNLDEAYLYTDSGRFVRLVMGEEWDTLSDYSVALEEALAPVNEYIDRHN